METEFPLKRLMLADRAEDTDMIGTNEFGKLHVARGVAGTIRPDAMSKEVV